MEEKRHEDGKKTGGRKWEIEEGKCCIGEKRGERGRLGYTYVKRDGKIGGRRKEGEGKRYSRKKERER